MKFICDKCKTKYSIADAKVKGKVLKIRCKNCSNIITVREQKRGPDGRQRRDSSPVGKSTGALGRALDGAFKETQPITQGMQVVAVPDIAPAPMGGPLTSEPTRLSDAPDFDEPPGEEEEWYLAVDGNQFGPMDLSELSNRVKRGEAGDEAFVWHDGFDDWLDVADVPQLQAYIPKHPPPPPKGKSGLLALGALVDDSEPADADLGALADEAVRPTTRHERTSEEIKPVPTPAPVVRRPVETGPQGQIALDKELLDTVPKEEEEEIGPIVPVASIQSVAQSPQGTPMLMKVTAAGGIVAAVSGLILVVYFLFLDRQPTKPDVTQTELAQVTPQPKKKAKPAVPEKAPEPEEAAVEIVFQPERITRTKTKPRPTRVASKSGSAKKPAGPELTEAQKRMMAMYKKTGGKTKIPGVAPVKRGAVQHRQISGAEVAGMYRKYKKNFQACYQRALKRDETLKELKVDVSIDVSGMGRVVSVTFRSLPSQDLKYCLTRIIKRWAFRPSGEQTIAFPLVFRGAG